MSIYSYKIHPVHQNRVSGQDDLHFTGAVADRRPGIPGILEPLSPHEGLGGSMVMPYPQDMDAPVREVSFLGGLLHGYRREKLAA